jgi:(S)-ureidoglycine aminohydrolase
LNLMRHLGHTRSAYRPDHLLLTPDTFVRAPLPGMRDATAIVHVSPAAGAAFTQFTALLEPDGEFAPAAWQRFIYVLEGNITIDGRVLAKGGYAYFPAGHPSVVRAAVSSRLAVIEKPYVSLAGVSAPGVLFGEESAVHPQPLEGDDALEVRALLPSAPAFDFAVNIMTYQPGASLPRVESHVMEHGLLMLEGGGIYRLGDNWYPVSEGDFIWMAPYCPQWFGSLGKTPAKYLIYKDWNR